MEKMMFEVGDKKKADMWASTHPYIFPLQSS